MAHSAKVSEIESFLGALAIVFMRNAGSNVNLHYLSEGSYLKNQWVKQLQG